jgi:peroxin-1
LSGEQAEAVREVLSSSMSEALDHAPSIIVLDDLDSAISFSAGSEGSEPSSSAIGLAEYLADLMDACQVFYSTRTSHFMP